MKIILENEDTDQRVEIESKKKEHITDVFSYLIVPALLAMTFHPSTIRSGLENALEECSE